MNCCLKCFTVGDTTTTTTTTTAASSTAAASATDKAASTVDSLHRDVTETRESVRKLDLRVEELTRDVSVLSNDVRTLLRVLHAVLHPDDDRSRPPASCSKHRQSTRDSSKTFTKLNRTESSSSRPPTSSVTQKKGGSPSGFLPENVELRLRRPPYDDPTRSSCSPKEVSPAPTTAAQSGQRLSRGSGSSSRESVMVDEVNAEAAASEQTYVFAESGGPPTASRREWQPGVVATTIDAGGTVRSKPRTVTAMQWDNVAGDSTQSPSSSTNSHASVLLTTDL